jgi:hypothetical protein
MYSKPVWNRLMNKKVFLFFIVMVLSVCGDVLAMNMQEHTSQSKKRSDIPIVTACETESSYSADDAMDDLCKKFPRLRHDEKGEEDVEPWCSFCNKIVNESSDDYFTFACGHDIQDSCLFNLLFGSCKCPRCHAVIAHSDLMGLVQGGRVNAVISILSKCDIPVEAAGMALIYAAFLNKSDVACAIIKNAALSSVAIQKALEIAIRDGNVGFVSNVAACCDSQTELLDTVLLYAARKLLDDVFPGLLKLRAISSHAVTEALFISLALQQRVAFFNLCWDWRVSEDVLGGVVRTAVDTSFITKQEANLFFEPFFMNQRERERDENCKLCSLGSE